jgi:hypothetical protein
VKNGIKNCEGDKLAQRKEEQLGICKRLNLSRKKMRRSHLERRDIYDQRK